MRCFQKFGGVVDLRPQNSDDSRELNRGDERFAPSATADRRKSTEDLHG